MTTPSQLASFNYATPPFANWPIKQLTNTYTLVASDNGYILNCTSGTFTINLLAPAVFPAGFCCWVWNTSNTATDVITLQGSPTQTIDGSSSIAIRKSSGTQIIFDGVRWQVGARTTMRGYSENINNNSAYAVASATGALALGQGATASGFYSTAIGFEPLASSNYGFAAGINSGASGSRANGTAAMALGGSYASGTDSFAAAVADNTVSYGARAANAITIGNRNQSTASTAVSVGDYNIASGILSQCFGDYCEATTTLAFAYGSQAKSPLYGKWSYASAAFAAAGDAQLGKMVLRRATTGNTPTALTSNNSAADATNQVILPNNSAFAFTGLVIARQQAAGGSDYAAWEIKGAIIRGATAASTTLGSFNINKLSATAGAAAWTIGLSADTTNGGLAITATGAAATNIRWVATVQTSEVIYA